MRKLILGFLVCVSLFGSDFEDYKQACDGGNAKGCFLLGGMYYNGRGIEQNNIKASELFRKACNYGSARGCFGLGVMYDLELNPHKALKFYDKACAMQLEDGCESSVSLKKELGQ